MRFEVFVFSTALCRGQLFATLRHPSVAQVISMLSNSEYKFYETIKTLNVNLTIRKRRWWFPRQKQSNSRP